MDFLGMAGGGLFREVPDAEESRFNGEGGRVGTPFLRSDTRTKLLGQYGIKNGRVRPILSCRLHLPPTAGGRRVGIPPSSLDYLYPCVRGLGR